MDKTRLGEVRVEVEDDELQNTLQQRTDTFPVDGLHQGKVTKLTFTPGPCQHNKKFACVFVPCAVPLFYIGGELLFGTAVLCLLIVYLIDNTSRGKRSSLVAFVLSALIFQLASMYCLIPFLWKFIFNIGLIFIYNVFIVLSGGVGLLQFKQLQHEEPEFVLNMEYILFVSYPVVSQLTLTAVAGNVFGWSVAPFFCVIFGFVILQVFYPPSHPSFTFQSAVHKLGEELPPDRFILGSMEKTLLLVNLVTVPGTMFIVINFLEFLYLITWVKLLLCGLLSVFLCTCLDIKDEMEFLEFSNDIVMKVKWGCGLSSLMLLCLILLSSGSISANTLPLIFGNIFCGLLVVVTNRRDKWKTYKPVALLFLLMVSLIGLYLLPWSLYFHFQFLSLPLWGFVLLLGLVSCLSVSCLLVASGSNRDWLNPVIVAHSIGFVLCENILATEKLYPVYFMLATMLFVGYVCQRLYSVGMLHNETMLLCIAVHGSKLPLCLSLILPFTPTTPVLLPSMFVVSPACLVFLFTLVLNKILQTERDLSSTEGIKLCAMAAIVTVGIYDILLLPLWFLLTHRIPSSADVLAAVLFVWGALCAKLSYVHFSHNLVVRRLNVVILCMAIMVELVQPEVNVYRALEAFVIYTVSLLYSTAFSTERCLLSEEVSLSWLILIGLSVLLAVLTKIFKVERMSWMQRLLISFLIGASPGLKAASMILPVTRPPLVCLLYGLSSAVTVYLLITSWRRARKESRDSLSVPYLCLVGCFFACLLLETLNPFHQNTFSGRQKSSEVSPCLYFHLFLQLLLGLALKRDDVFQDSSLEETKGRLSSGLVLQSSSFFSNVSLFVTLILALFCSPSEYWEMWVSFAIFLLLFLRPEGAPYIRGSRLQFTPALPASVVLAVCMYNRTVIETLPTDVTWLSVTGYILEILFLLCSLPTYIVLVHALWSGEILLVEQQVVMFVAPSNFILLIYCSTWAARILGFVGIGAVYWIFYYVQASGRKF